MNDMERVLKILKKYKNEVFVMATVIGVVGSAYRHEGAKMLIGQDGRTYGMVSGGCLEEDLCHRSHEVFLTRMSQIATYDLTHEDDLRWGRGSGCNGTIKILLERVQWNEQWTQVEKWMEEGRRVVRITTVEGDLHRSEVFWNGSDILSNQANGLEREIPRVKDKMEFQWSVKRKGELLFERYKPKDFLYIFGAGADAQPLVELASRLDFNVRIVDPREDRCCYTYFPHADQCIVQHPHIFLAHHTLPLHPYVVIMTHSFEWDQQILRHFIQYPPRYLGILGPRRRTKRLLDDQDIPNWIRSPIGLHVLAEGPEEISVSIAAELLMVRNGAVHSSF